MPVIALSALVSLATVLLLSGAAKLAVPDTGRTILTTAPLPRALRAPWLQRALPWGEILLAACLLLGSGPFLLLSTFAATALFTVFTVVVLQGTRAPDPASCGCFGGLSRAPVSRRTVVRNAAFTLTAALALVLSAVVFHGPVLHLPWWGVTGLAIPVLLVLLILWSEQPARGGAGDPSDVARVPPLPRTLREDGDAAASPPVSPGTTAADAVATEGPATEPGGPQQADDEPQDYERLPIPYAGLTTADGQVVTLRGLSATRARALVTVSLTCGWCAPMIQRLTELGSHTGPVALHAVVAHEDEREQLPEALRGAALVDADQAAAIVFDRPGNPWAVVLGADGLLAGGPVAGSGAVLELLDELAERFAG